MKPLCDPVVEERYGRQVAAFKNAAGEPVCDIAVIPYECIPILVHLDPAAVNKTVPWPSVREAHPLLTEMDRLGYHHWNSESYRDFCRHLGLDPDRNRPTFDPSVAEVGETLVLRACIIHEEQTKVRKTYFSISKEAVLHKLVAFLRVGGDRSLQTYESIQWRIREIAAELAGDPDRLLIARAVLEAGRLVVKPEPEMVWEDKPLVWAEEQQGFLSRLLDLLRAPRLH